MPDKAYEAAQDAKISAAIRRSRAVRGAPVRATPVSTPDPSKGLMNRMADALRASPVGDLFRNAGGGGGEAGQAKRADMDRIVNEMVTGRQRAGQSTDKSNGY